ncbi:protein SUPPRESSOR OF PHYA-105 1-like [Andrographis paniculata]|uniref:protein SUPPRESSOR OF PHYA-105 1-like n=1 Tax=Andrographis paniculata TaxID=175694 RepID=UPI0021E86671|nr:protein SUPPRESSOR OF PHYA-105 1-like [Andrographis paniculata]XP_051144591.1 protein SUPPRESSOR OF PHYA-105 1-like [Andrographis paniculata]XP_051144592.1 protein SUPPRESSOR OF PHYA-105 1-like [Andrographis paniculata]
MESRNIEDSQVCKNRRIDREGSTLALSVSTSNEQPGSSTMTSLNTGSDSNSNTLSAYSWFSVRKSTLRNYRYSNTGDEANFHVKTSRIFQEAKYLSGTHHTGSPPSNAVIDRHVGKNSSSFSSFFLGQASPAKPELNQLHSDSSIVERPESNHFGITLRQWLAVKRSAASKMDKLRLFKQIVHTVDSLHCGGYALLELQPSAFVLSESGDVKYIGLLQDTESSKPCKRRRGLDLSASEDTAENSWLEKKWYACPEGMDASDLLSSNIYSLGLLLFEFLCHFESMEACSAAMKDLQCRILPPSFLSECPKEAGFCFWLLHPDPSSRPTAREILQSEMLDGFKVSCPSDDGASVIDTESDLLLHFLVSLKEHMQNKVSTLSKSIEFLDEDIKEVEQKYACKKFTDMKSKHLDQNRRRLQEKLFENISQLEKAYFCLKSPIQIQQTPDVDRSDKDVLTSRDTWPLVETLNSTDERSFNRVGALFDGICKYARYIKFEVCGTLRNTDILNSNNVICSLSFDREEEYIATAGVSKKIKIFELASLLNDYVDVQYPVLEMSNKSKFSCICWNGYIKNYLASVDYDGLVQIWDTSTGRVFANYMEHQRRAWSVDFSLFDPTKFASGGDDCSVRIWSTNEKNSIGTIWNQANICCVQFSAFSSHLLAFGSADYRIYCYDLRHTRSPWCILAGHGKAVSYVKHLDPETVVSASTDNTLKLWDLKKTSLEGLSSDACQLTLTGHTNERNFVGMSVSDGYIVCGSETNEVYAYYRSLPMPITSHKFEGADPTTGHKLSDGNGQFVSSVCWRKKFGMIAAANSTGSMKILRLV